MGPTTEGCPFMRLPVIPRGSADQRSAWCGEAAELSRQQSAQLLEGFHGASHQE